VEAEFARIAEEGVSPDELRRARAMLRSSRVGQMQSCLSRGMTLGRYELFDGNPALVNEDLQRLLRVEAAEIQDLARRLFRRECQAALQVRPAAMAAENPHSGREA